MQIIKMIINMGNIRQERPNKDPNLKSNKRNLNKFGTHVKESVVFQSLKK